MACEHEAGKARTNKHQVIVNSLEILSINLIFLIDVYIFTLN